MPSKALLHAASIHDLGGDYHWQRASDFRDWMIVRERPRDWPNDSGHVKDLEAAGAVIAAPGAADAIGEAVLAIKTRTPIDVLADTIHPSPTTVRVMGDLFVQAARRSRPGTEAEG